MKNKRIYLDNNATTRVSSEVLAAMLPFFQENYGNPSAGYEEGRVASKALDQARANVAELINADPDEITFTSGGTESNNLVFNSFTSSTPAHQLHIVTTTIEHSSIYAVCKHLELAGARITYLPVDHNGRVEFAEYKKVLNDKVNLVSIMLANNEIGTVQDITALSKEAAKYNIPFHTDAIQAVGKIPVDVKELNVDYLTISGHKLYGPKGVGAVYTRKKNKIIPLLYGGGQENNNRSGTENLPAIVGLGEACRQISKNLIADIFHYEDIRDYMEKGILENIPQTAVAGDLENRTPNTSSISFRDIDSQTIVSQLDLRGISVSTGAACSFGDKNTSRVLKAIRLPIDRMNSTLRLSVGKQTTMSDIDRTIEELKIIYEQVTSARPATVDLKSL